MNRAPSIAAWLWLLAAWLALCLGVWCLWTRNADRGMACAAAAWACLANARLCRLERRLA